MDLMQLSGHFSGLKRPESLSAGRSHVLNPPVAEHLRLRKPLEGDVFFKGAQKKPYEHPGRFDLINRLYELGAPDKESSKKVIFQVSRHFSADGKSQNYTYGNLLEDTRRMAAAYQKAGLAGKRIAVAETNSLDLLSTYYGGLAVGATMVPLNLLALQDEGTKMDRLVHMITGPKSDAFVFGRDPLFKDMYGFQKVLTLKKPILRGVAQRYVAGKPPRKNILDGLLYRKLDQEMARKLGVAVAKLQEKGVAVSDADRQEIAAKIRRDFATLYNALPAKLKLVTPESKTRMMRTAPMHPSNLLLNPAPEALADIIFTSGTSGNPKGVGLTHENLVFTANSLSEGIGDLIRPDDVMLLGLPLFHIFAKAVLLTGMNRQIPMVLLPSLGEAIKSLDKVVKTIEEYKVTALPAVPRFLEMLVEYADKNPDAKQALGNLRLVISGGAALKKSTYDALKAINPNILIVEGYGSSEGGINTVNKSGVQGYVGHELPGVEVRLRESDPKHAFHNFHMTTGQGEILVRSPGVAKSYVEGTVPEGTPLSIVDELGLYHTGDQGRRLNVLRPSAWLDDFGSMAVGPLQIVGRDSNFIKDAGGERRDPGEFEAAVRQAAPQIRDAMAVSFKPDRETEKSVVLAVSSDPAVTEASIKQAMTVLVASGKIPGALVPKHIIVLRRESLPDAFRNDFKREAGYKVVKDFVKQLVDRQVITLQDKSAGSREQTVVPDSAALEAFADAYRYSG